MGYKCAGQNRANLYSKTIKKPFHVGRAGAKVHDCIEHTLTNLLRGISVLDVDQIVDITLNQMREEFRSSREKRRGAVDLIFLQLGLIQIIEHGIKQV